MTTCPICGDPKSPSDDTCRWESCEETFELKRDAEVLRGFGRKVHPSITEEGRAYAIYDTYGIDPGLIDPESAASHIENSDLESDPSDWDEAMGNGGITR